MHYIITYITQSCKIASFTSECWLVSALCMFIGPGGIFKSRPSINYPGEFPLLKKILWCSPNLVLVAPCITWYTACNT